MQTSALQNKLTFSLYLKKKNIVTFFLLTYKTTHLFKSLFFFNFILYLFTVKLGLQTECDKTIKYILNETKDYQ